MASEMGSSPARNHRPRFALRLEEEFPTGGSMRRSSWAGLQYLWLPSSVSEWLPSSVSEWLPSSVAQSTNPAEKKNKNNQKRKNGKKKKKKKKSSGSRSSNSSSPSSEKEKIPSSQPSTADKEEKPAVVNNFVWRGDDNDDVWYDSDVKRELFKWIYIPLLRDDAGVHNYNAVKEVISQVVPTLLSNEEVGS